MRTGLMLFSFVGLSIERNQRMAQRVVADRNPQCRSIDTCGPKVDPAEDAGIHYFVESSREAVELAGDSRHSDGDYVKRCLFAELLR